MSYKRISPTPVVEGGTGLQATTSYAVVCGGTSTTGALQSVASVGSANQVLTSNGAAALPTFQAVSASGAVTTLTGSTSGGAISPSAGNINITAGTGITVVGTTNTLTISSNNVTAYTNVNTSPYVVLSTDDYLSVDCSAGAITIQLPNAATLGRIIDIKDRTGSAATHNITVTTVGGSVNIDGATTFVMNTAYQAISAIGNASTYEVF
jgi:hypothetical protein